MVQAVVPRGTTLDEAAAAPAPVAPADRVRRGVAVLRVPLSSEGRAVGVRLSPALHAQPRPLLQFRLRAMQVSPHAFPIVQTRQQALVSTAPRAGLASHSPIASKGVAGAPSSGRSRKDRRSVRRMGRAGRWDAVAPWYCSGNPVPAHGRQEGSGAPPDKLAPSDRQEGNPLNGNHIGAAGPVQENSAAGCGHVPRRLRGDRFGVACSAAHRAACRCDSEEGRSQPRNGRSGDASSKKSRTLHERVVQPDLGPCRIASREGRRADPGR